MLLGSAVVLTGEIYFRSLINQYSECSESIDFVVVFGEKHVSMSTSASICLRASKALVSTKRTQLIRVSVTMDTMVSTARNLFSVFFKISSVRTEESASTATVFDCLIFYLVSCFKILVFFQEAGIQNVKSKILQVSKMSRVNLQKCQISY